eukprot:CAMPEP_0181501658 /NCGR_PEP_ID=MMETSP1110-20121109/55915_1 /TAXON_ID=174948 /ORGANISM="Symbiodinium sp., Strain CCMP421" /LENGTH=46 /DNA_ID= /DNA_START= /DNA_END= /DNA_ORIENTATION=
MALCIHPADASEDPRHLFQAKPRGDADAELRLRALQLRKTHQEPKG